MHTYHGLGSAPKKDRQDHRPRRTSDSLSDIYVFAHALYTLCRLPNYKKEKKNKTRKKGTQDCSCAAMTKVEELLDTDYSQKLLLDGRFAKSIFMHMIYIYYIC